MERDICNYHRGGSRNFCPGVSDLRTKLMKPIIPRFCLFKSWERRWLQICSVTYTHAQRHDTNGTHHILLVTTSSPVRFSLAFKVGQEKARPTPKGKAPWGRGCPRKGPSFETIMPGIMRQNSYVPIYSNSDQIP